MQYSQRKLQRSVTETRRLRRGRPRRSSRRAGWDEIGTGSAFVLILRLEARNDAGIRKRGGIAEDAAFGDIAEQAAHDLCAARLGQFGREEDVVGAGDGADFRYDVLLELFLEAVAEGDAFLQGDERGDALPFHIVRLADHGGFGDGRM